MRIRSSTQLNIDDDLDLDSHKIVDLADPTADQDAATKKYVDDEVAGAVGGPHAASHQDGGADELSLAGLSGTSADVLAHLVDALAAHDASAISVSPTVLGAAEVQAALEALEAALGGGGHAEAHDHDGAPTQKLAQANTHETPDTNAGPTSLHHTLGTGTNQAAAGSHATHARHAVHTYRTTNKAIVTATDTVVDFDGERYDTHGYHDTVTDNSRHTAPSDGLYDCKFNSDWANANGGYREARLRKTAAAGGSVYIGLQTAWAGNGTDGVRNSVSAQVDLLAGDYIEVLVRQTQGANLNLQSANNYGIEFMMRRVSD